MKLTFIKIACPLGMLSNISPPPPLSTHQKSISEITTSIDNNGVRMVSLYKHHIHFFFKIIYKNAFTIKMFCCKRKKKSNQFKTNDTIIG